MPKAKKPLAPTPSEKQVLTMPEANSVTPIRKAAPAAAPTPNSTLEAQVRQRAYELYQERGCTPGHENEDWLQAESEILARQNQRQSA
jgi:hypothetical protein